MNFTCKAIFSIAISFPLLGFAQVANRTFHASTEFDAVFDGFVEVVLECNSGYPLVQSFELLPGDSVIFTVNEMLDVGTCHITQSVAENFITSYLANGMPSDEACKFIGGEDGNLLIENTCEVKNTAPSTSYTYVSECGVNSNSDNEVFIVTNDIQATTSPCITVSHANVVVDCEGKTITGPGGGLHYGIRINDTGEGVTIRDCKLTEWWLSILQQSDNGLIYENRMTDCGFGIVLSSANANEVATNVIGRCSWDAIAVLHSNENLIRDNGAFLNPNMRGILLDHSNNNDVVDNRIGRNAGGIYLGESHENNLIDNVSKGNEYVGIRLRDSRDNLIADNNASRNGIGIEEVGEDLNNIYDDNVCRNNTIADSNIDEACN